MEERASLGRYRIVEAGTASEVRLVVHGPGISRGGVTLDAELGTVLDLMNRAYLAGKKARSRELWDLLRERTNDGVAP